MDRQLAMQHTGAGGPGIPPCCASPRHAFVSARTSQRP